jgi:hypothetical protein
MRAAINGNHEITLLAAGAGEDRLQAEAAERTERRHDVTVRTRWANLEGVYWGDEGFAFKHAA